MTMRRHLRTLSNGRMALILMEPPTGSARRTTWRSMTTAGPRDLCFASGQVVHDGREDEETQALAIAMEASLSAGPPSVWERTAPLMLIEAAETDPEMLSRMFSVCGRSTLTAAAQGLDTDGFALLDAVASFEKVEALFEAWPFLLAPLLGAQSAIDPAHGQISRVTTGQHALSQRLAMLDLRDVAGVAQALIDFCKGCVELPPGAEEEGSDVEVALELLRIDRVALFLKRLRTPEGVAPSAHAAAVVPSLPQLIKTLALACSVAPDWLPSDTLALFDFVSVAVCLHPMVRESRGAIGYGDLVASSKGRWRDFASRLPNENAAADVRDMVEAFWRQCALPAFLHSLTTADGFRRYDAGLRVAIGSSVGQTAASDVEIARTCWRLLFARRSAVAILDASEEWHRAAPAMDANIGTLERHGWDAPFEPITISDGVQLVPIVDSLALAEEGAALKHCVGGSSFVEACMERACVIASIRRTNPDGTVVPTSTVEFTGWKPGKIWRPTVAQHRGLLNAQPSGDDEHDLAVALDVIMAAPAVPERIEPKSAPEPFHPVRMLRESVEEARGLLAFDPAVYGPVRTVMLDPVARAARYDWLAEKPMQVAFMEWSRFLSRPIRSDGVAGFVRHFELAADAEFASALRSRVEAAAAGYRPAGAMMVAAMVPSIVARRFTETRLFAKLRPVLAPRFAALAAVATLFCGLAYHLWPAGSDAARVGRTEVPMVAVHAPSSAVATTTTVTGAAPGSVCITYAGSAVGGNVASLCGAGGAGASSTSSSAGIGAGTTTWTTATSVPTVTSVAPVETVKPEAQSGGTRPYAVSRDPMSSSTVERLTLALKGAGPSGRLYVRLMALIEASPDWCLPDGRLLPRIDDFAGDSTKGGRGRYPCALASDLLAVADGDMVSVYRRGVGGGLGHVLTSVQANGAVTEEGAGIDTWRPWIEDRLNNGTK